MPGVGNIEIPHPKNEKLGMMFEGELQACAPESKFPLCGGGPSRHVKQAQTRQRGPPAEIRNSKN